MVRRAGVVEPIKWGALSRAYAVNCAYALDRACALSRVLLGISLIWALGSSLLL